MAGEALSTSVRISSGPESMRPHYGVIVVGSGYGGGIAASRLARAGQDVCILERGRERRPGEFPRTQMEGAREIQLSTRDSHLGSRLGLFDLHAGEGISVLVGCGLGGTSLINANVSLPPDPRLWSDPRWPAEVRADVETRLAEGYARAREMLRPTPYPASFPDLPKLDALEKSSRALGAPFYRPPINVSFQDGPNHVGLDQKACVGCGDCVTGCNHSAKNTTLMNYLQDAWNHGAQIVTQAKVDWLERREGKWVVHYQVVGEGREAFAAPDLFVTADVVVLAAGSLGSTEILLRSKARGLPLSERVGERFSGNGDVLGFGYDCEDVVNGIGFGSHEPGRIPAVGPCITGIIDERAAPAVGDGFVIEDGSVPGALSPLLPEAFGMAAIAFGDDTDTRLADLVKQEERSATSLLLGPYHGATKRTQTFLVMAHDGEGGRLRLEGDRLRVAWPDVGREAIFARVNERLRQATAALKGDFIENPAWSEALGRGLITVHPLGGSVMADRAEEGVVDGRCRVFAGGAGAAVHEGLLVADGSVVPMSLGVNPLLTISALAERACALLAEERGWTIPYDLPSRPRRAPEPLTPGLRFTETMRGEFTARGAPAPTPMSFTLTIVSGDLERMLADPEHRAAIFGTLDAPALSARPLVVSQGEFRLFAKDPARVETRNMVYRMRVETEEGASFLFHGVKIIDHEAPTEAWSQTTTLHVDVHRGADETGALVGSGVLHIAPLDFMRQMTTMEITNAPDEATRLKGFAAFGAAFAGTLYDAYGGVLAPEAYFDPRLPPRRKRPLRAGPPEVHGFATRDGVPLRLTRYRGGPKGPVMLVHGAGVSSRIFSTDLPHTNLVEYLVAHRYDVWLLDCRVSIALPSCAQPWTADQVAAFDLPDAVAAIRRLTGAASVQAVAHCYGANAFVMAMLGGMEGVRSAVLSQVATDLVVPPLTRLKVGLHAPEMLAHLGVSSLTAYADAKEGWRSRLLDDALRLYPVHAGEGCQSPVCHRIAFMYGELIEHAQLDERTHENLHELFGLGSMTTFEHLARMVRAGHVVAFDGSEAYLPHLERLAIPIRFIHGDQNRCYLPESTQRAMDRLAGANGAGLYTRSLIEGYGHIDCIFGKNAARDVFHHVLDHLDATQDAASARHIPAQGAPATPPTGPGQPAR